MIGMCLDPLQSSAHGCLFEDWHYEDHMNLAINQGHHPHQILLELVNSLSLTWMTGLKELAPVVGFSSSEASSTSHLEKVVANLSWNPRRKPESPSQRQMCMSL